MPSKKAKIKRGKTKTTDGVAADESYFQWLDENYYVGKTQRTLAEDVQRKKISVAIKAFTRAQSLFWEMQLLDPTNPLLSAGVVPMVCVPSIIRSIGFNPTTNQLMQIGMLTIIGDNIMAKRPTEPVQRRLWEERQRDVLSQCMTATTISFDCCTFSADRMKVEAIGLELMQKGMFLFDPLKVSPIFVSLVASMTRTYVVLQKSDTEVMDNVFRALWATLSGHEDEEDKVKRIDIASLRHILVSYMEGPGEAEEEPPLTKAEVDVFINDVSTPLVDSIDEDTFALVAA
uniref:WGS project CAEQ00000000 data, annotated contig 895 n=1 Tax=Trypanosoma congolense (strain IL3000) TaxID=1068625 RepID=F9WJB9_TRYCI|nr:unnamed protein product [Trypanosoma congolense IL3000]